MVPPDSRRVPRVPRYSGFCSLGSYFVYVTFTLYRRTSQTVLQKVRGRSYKDLPQLVDTGFQVLFHSPPGVLFTFPSQYYALSVTE